MDDVEVLVDQIIEGKMIRDVAESISDDYSFGVLNPKGEMMKPQGRDFLHRHILNRHNLDEPEALDKGFVMVGKGPSAVSITLNHGNDQSVDHAMKYLKDTWKPGQRIDIMSHGPKGSVSYYGKDFDKAVSTIIKKHVDSDIKYSHD